MHSRILLGLLIPILWLMSSDRSAQPGAEAKALVLEHVTVIDATGAPPKPDMMVVIVAGRISDIGKSGSVQVPQGAQTMNARTKFLIPGLWDMHAHVLNDKGPDILLPMLVANGVTGAREMGNDNDVPIEAMDRMRKEIEQGKLIGPHIVMAGHIIDGPKPVLPSNVSVSTEAQARETVIALKKSGVDFIKVYTALPRNLYFAIAEEANRQGLPFVGHVPIAVTAEEASDAGQKSLEHMTGVIDSCSTRETELRQALLERYEKFNGSTSELVRFLFVIYQQQLLDSYDEKKAGALFEHLRKNGTWQCPTLVALRSVAFFDDRSFVNDLRLKYVPRSWTFWTDPNRQQTNDFFKDLTAEDFANEKRAVQKRLQIVGAMHRAGVKFLAGTDTAVPSVYPGFSLHEELALFVKAGMTPMEALQSATLNPAVFLNLQDTLGTVEKGKIADLLLLDANPLENINNIRQINAVFVNGRLLDRKALDNVLAQVEAAARKN
jgi:hypothetical protein